VKQEQARRGGLRDRIAVDGDAIERGQQRGGSGYRLSVQGDAAFLDHPLDLTARGYARAGEELGYALGLILSAGCCGSTSGVRIGWFLRSGLGLAEGRASGP
jgi:hypothetical protein